MSEKSGAMTAAFDKLKITQGKKKEVPTELALFRKIIKEESEGLAAEMDKRKFKADFKARVIVVFDVSYSMQDEFENGKVNRLFNKFAALAQRFDQDATFEVIPFGRFAGEPIPVKIDEVPKFSKKLYEATIGLEESAESICAGTNYASAFEQLGKVYRKSSISDSTPVYCAFITDGDTVEAKKAHEKMNELGNLPIFLKFLGLCNDPKNKFSFLKRLDTSKAKVKVAGKTVKIDNADFQSFTRVSELGPKQLLEEFDSWIKQAQKYNILTGEHMQPRTGLMSKFGF